MFQVEATKKAREEYKKAMKMIETAKADAARAAAAVSAAAAAAEAVAAEAFNKPVLGRPGTAECVCQLLRVCFDRVDK